MQDDPIVITGAARTPIGSFQGVLSDVSATNLGATAIAAAIDRSAIEPESVEEVIMGCVLPAACVRLPPDKQLSAEAYHSRRRAQRLTRCAALE